MQEKKDRKIFRNISIIVVILIVAGGIFYGGIILGKTYYPSINLIKGLENKELGQPADVDFSIFWDAWRIIQSDYLKSDSLDKKEMVHGAIAGLLNSLGDQHSTFFTPKEAKIFQEDANGSFSGVGMEIGLRDKQLTVIAPMEDTPAWRAGMKAGDKIVEIDEKSTDGITAEAAVRQIRGEKGTTVKLKIMRDSFDKPKEFPIIRDTIVVASVKLYFTDNNIAHLKLSNFSEKAPYDFYLAALDILKNQSQGLVLDLRNNPGGYLDVSINIAGWLINKEDTVTIERVKNGDDEILKASGNEALKDLPIVVLVNGGSASASEILAGALRDNRGIQIIGEKTFGKGSVQTVKTLFDDSMIKITVAEWLTPSGLSINKNGIEPDYKVELPEDWQTDDPDPQLQKALEVLQNVILNK